MAGARSKVRGVRRMVWLTARRWAAGAQGFTRSRRIHAGPLKRVANQAVDRNRHGCQSRTRRVRPSVASIARAR